MKPAFERILLATEHTEFDVGAERVAFALSKHCGLPLDGVFPMRSNPEYEIEAPQLVVKAEREAADKITEVCAAAELMGVKLNVRARRGEMRFREVVDEAARLHSDIIVVRRRGKRGFLAQLMIGEMVSKIVGHAPCSVLTVPRAAQMWQSGILVAVDAAPSAANSVRVATEIAAICGLPLTVLSVAALDFAPQRAEAEAIVARHLASVQAAGVQGTGMVRCGKAFEQIVQGAQSAGADLIVVGRQSEGGIIKAMLGGTAQKVVGLAETPVLVVHD
ncbi:MAG: universal stress protein [Nitrosomonadales bacterium]|nr:universal stress protein [Nitrosomonadales bacterium]